MSKSSNPPKQLMNLSHKGAGKSQIAQNGPQAISFDLKELVAPSRTYSAELCSVQYRNAEVYFIFAQRNLVGDGLESAISLRMHGFYAQQFLKSIDAMQQPNLIAIAAQTHTISEPVEEIVNNPSHLAKMSANIVQLAVSGYDVCCDFYQLNAANVAKIAEKKEGVNLVPVARVEMRTALFLGVYDELLRLRPQFPNDQIGGAVFAGDI